MDNGQANEVIESAGLESKSVDWPQEQKITSVKEAVGQAMNTIHRFCPACRESSFALAKLEEAAMWATKAIANPQ